MKYVLLVALIIPTIAFAQKTCFGVMFDAGSSGTRVYVYNWPCRTEQITPKVKISEDIPNKSIRPGISSFVNDPSSAGMSLEPLLSFASTIVPQSQRSMTPIFLRATAGMRLLPIDKQDLILTSIKNYFKNSGYRMDNDNWVAVISGAEEGAFGWVAVNYLYHLIDANVPKLDTNVVMDCGGASVQLTFAQAKRLSFSSYLNLEFHDVNNYTLYTHSYLGYGNDQAREAVLKMTYDNQSSVIYSPCFHLGFNSTKIAAFNPNLLVIGTGNYTQCRSMIRQYLMLNNSCSQCSIGGNFQPVVPANMSLNGINSYVFISQFFNMGDSYTINDLIKNSSIFCTKSWNNVLQEYASDQFLATRCFAATLLVELTTSGFGINANRTIVTKDKVGNVTVAWTLGSILYDISSSECSVGTELCFGGINNNVDPAVIVPIVLACVFVMAGVIIIVVSLVLYSRKKKYTRVPDRYGQENISRYYSFTE